MEKTDNTMAIVKGSTAAAAEVIAVDVDEEALCCPRCLHPLVPPVFQCAAGHLVCSACHDNLPDKNKCVSCFIKTGFTRYSIPTNYSRCHGVERILRSVRVACPNAIHGCTAGKMLYHEKEEHEKTCPSAADGGVVRDMDVRGVSRIIKVVVWHREAVTVDAMSVMYERAGLEEKTDIWGKPFPGTEPSEICLESDEYLIGVKGHIGANVVWCSVKSLTFISNRRTFGPYGVEDGEQFELRAAAGGRIVGFHGRSNSYYLYALGTYVKMGPCGGNGGKNREMDVGGVERIVQVVVWHGGAVDAMSVVYEQGGMEKKTNPTWGDPANTRSEICLEPDEYLTGVKGRIGDFFGSCVRSLTFISNRRTFGPYGAEDGEQFELQAAAGGRIVGFHGRSGYYLIAIGTYVKMDV